jgi:ubiquinone biosynthesis protein
MEMIALWGRPLILTRVPHLALHRLDHDACEVRLLELLGRAEPSGAGHVDFHELVAHDVEPDEDHAVHHQLRADHVRDAQRYVVDLRTPHLAAGGDVAPHIGPRSHAPEGRVLPVVHERDAVHEEHAHIAFLCRRQILLRNDVAVAAHSVDHLVQIGGLFRTHQEDALPPGALKRLQDEVEPFDSERAERILAEELGVRISKAFSRFDSEPIASASLGQVHYAEMRDGRPVAVKIQRPGVRQQVAGDLEAMEKVAEVMAARTEFGERFDLVAMVGEFRRTLTDELDYRQEARNLERLGENLKKFDRLLVPRPIMDFTTSRVLVMEWVRGVKITSLYPLGRMELDGEELASRLFEAYLQQVLVDGFFHADPHPGNLSLTADHRIALLDLGTVARMSSGLQEKMVRFLMAVSEGDGEEAAQVAMKLGEPGPNFDEIGFVTSVTELVDRQQGVVAKGIELGKVVLGVTRTASEHGVRIPGDLSMLGKTLLNLDRVGRTLDLLASNRVRFEVDAFDKVYMMEGFQKIANRSTLGLVMAALVVGAALLMQVETNLTLLDYPGLAMILFIDAVAGGFALVVSIVRTDETPARGHDQTGPGRR